MYYPVIGLEIHIELETKSKMFCACPNDPRQVRPNVNICPICLGHPGTLPVTNKEAVKKVIKTGLAFNCQISQFCQFDRKNYFYPDLPKGYQISQHFSPLCRNGFLDIDGKKVRIREIHLEEDTCKLSHPEGADFSLVDCNRAGIPLMELVTEPDLVSGIEVRKFGQELQTILRYLGVSGADMEKGQMRIEVNISVSRTEGELGTKVELKNINSFRSAERATVFEIERQKEALKAGEEIVQETRGWDEKRERTFSQREKETSLDYRYFPDPDLPPLRIGGDLIEEIKKEVRELPSKKRERLEREYSLPPEDIETLIQDRDLSEFFEKVVSELPPRLSHEELLRMTKLVVNYLKTDLTALLKGVSVASKDFLITPENFAEFITMIFKEEISSKAAKEVLKEMFATGADPSQLVEEKGLSQITDGNIIEDIVKKVISQNQKAVADYKIGKEQALQFLVGKVMAESKGAASPQLARSLLEKNIQ